MKRLLLVIAILLLAGAGYFTYEKWVKHANLTGWSFIPQGAAAVYEVELLDDYQTISSYPVWKSLSETSGFQRINQSIDFLDSINGPDGFQSIFKGVPVLISMHKISRDELDFLFVVDIQNISQNTFVSGALGRLQEEGYRFKTRNYNGFNISEISRDSQVFTYIFYRNYLLASFTPYLVEDAIRTIEGDQPSYQQNFLRMEKPLSDGLFNVHVNYGQTENLLSGLTVDPVSIPIHSGTYSAAIDSNYIHISGFSYSTKGWLATHQRPPAAFDMAEVVPENTAFIYHISSTDMPDWKEKQMEFLAANEPSIKKYQDSLKIAYDFNADQVIDLVDEEIGVLQLESANVRDNSRMCILELKNTEEALDFFKRLSERIALSRGDSVYVENYSENEIRYLPIKNFPATFLGSLAHGFDQCFYVNHRNFLIFSNSLQELKSLIASIQNEDTWGKSLRVNAFMQRTNNAANVSLFVSIPRALNVINEGLNDPWKSYLQKNLPVFQSFELAAFQFSYLDDNYFTNFTFSQPEEIITTIPKTNPETGVRFSGPIVTKPFLVKTHAHRDLDIMLQDSTNIVYYLNKDQDTRWSQALESRIISDIFPIDYYKNGKIQYAFATNKNVHIWDRVGEAIPGFPKPLPDGKEISHFNLIDYDLSRNYRMAVTDTDGNIFLTDKDLKALEGWNPRKFDRAALTPLTHARMGRNDVMIHLQENGLIHVTNRRGEKMKGFPFDTKQLLDKNYFLRTSNSLSNSSLTVISSGGVLIELNLEGDLIRQDQLLKSMAEAQFQLITDRGGKSFLIVRKEGNTYDVLDDTGNLLFKKDYLSGEPVIIQYYQFGAGKDLIIFTDTSNDSLYIYDKAGKLITGNPLSSAREVSIIYSSVNREFQVFTTSGSNLELYTFKN